MERKNGIVTKMLKPIFLQNEVSRIGNFNENPFPDIPFENIYLKTKDNIKIGLWILKAKDPQKYLIMLHGNGSNRAGFVEAFGLNRYVERGFTLLIPDYRGFADSEGEFWVDTVNFDIEAVHNYCIETFKQQPDILGFSLGGSIALEYYKYSNFTNKMIIMSTFSSTLDILKEQNLWNIASFCLPFAEQQILNEFNYKTSENIKVVDKNKVLIIHGKVDELILPKHSMKLAEISGCELVLFPKDDHLSLFFNYEVLAKVEEFLKK